MAAEELYDYIRNGNIRNSVNMPNARMDRTGVCRLCILHRNVPRMLTNFLNLIGGMEINVDNMINKSRGEYAYTILDLGTVIGPEEAAQIAGMDSVLRVRVL